MLGIYLWDYLPRRKNQLSVSSKTDETADSTTDSGSWVDVDPASANNDLLAPDPLILDPLATTSTAIDPDDRLSIYPEQDTDALNRPSISTIDPVESTVKTSPVVDTRIIQFSLVPKDAEYFSGNLLVEALTDVGLEYGKPGIFHRYFGENDSRELIFSVTNMVNPGTFPIDDMNSFQCPGITLFLQTDMVADPLEAFDDLTSIGHLLVYRLFGKLLNANRQEVTMGDIIEPIRDSLKAKISLSNV